MKCACRVAAQFGDVRIVAPDVEQSSMGHAITANRPLRSRRTPVSEFEGFRVTGTPADCVALGVYEWGGADLVLSGINLGTNLGSSIWHSGTLAAAKQAVLLGLRGFAFSTPATDEEPDFEKLSDAELVERDGLYRELYDLQVKRSPRSDGDTWQEGETEGLA